MKRTLLTLLAALVLLPALADEGMWLPSLISERIDDMRAKGFRLTAEDIYSINKASMKDAVVLFNGGCTGELISPGGLLLTNHHCGYDAIQKHSTVEHDYLTNGFWAMSRAEELPNEKLWVRFLVPVSYTHLDVYKRQVPRRGTTRRSEIPSYPPASKCPAGKANRHSRRPPRRGRRCRFRSGRRPSGPKSPCRAGSEPRKAQKIVSWNQVVLGHKDR